MPLCSEKVQRKQLLRVCSYLHQALISDVAKSELQVKISTPPGDVPVLAFP